MSVSIYGNGTITGVSTFNVGTGASIASPAANEISFETNNTQVIHVNRNVGIGTTGDSDPANGRKLTVNDNNAILRISSPGSAPSGYQQLEFHSRDSGHSAWIWHNSTSNVGYGGTNSLNYYNSNGAHSFFTNGTANRLTIDMDGNVTKLYQPSFHAYSPAVTSSGNTIVFGSTFHNIGSHYNTSNGQFTAPVSGRYLFCFAVLVSSDGSSSNYGRITFKKNNTADGTLYQHGDTLSSGGNGVYQSPGASLVIELSANDTMSLHVEGYSTYGTPYGAFSGHLLG
jgi:hypothetical protein